MSLLINNNKAYGPFAEDLDNYQRELNDSSLDLAMEAKIRQIALNTGQRISGQKRTHSDEETLSNKRRRIFSSNDNTVVDEKSADSIEKTEVVDEMIIETAVEFEPISEAVYELSTELREKIEQNFSKDNLGELISNALKLHGDLEDYVNREGILEQLNTWKMEQMTRVPYLIELCTSITSDEQNEYIDIVINKMETSIDGLITYLIFEEGEEKADLRENQLREKLPSYSYSLKSSDGSSK